MEKLKFQRSLWVLAGVCFLIAFIIDVSEKKLVSLSVLQGFTCILCFINAFLKNSKINKNNKS